MALDNLLDGLKEILNIKDKKYNELQNHKLKVMDEIKNITKDIEEISYKALIEEDKDSIKTHKDLKVLLKKKEDELLVIDEKIKALDKFEVDKSTKEKANGIYKEIQKEIDSNSIKLGKKLDAYTKAKNELKSTSLEIISLYNETNLLPLKLRQVLDMLDPEDIGRTEEDIEEFKEILRTSNLDRYLYLFEDTRLNHGKNTDRKDVNRILNARNTGDLNINLYH